MKMETGKNYTANPTYTNLMNRERRLQDEIRRLEAELRQVTAEKNQTEPYLPPNQTNR